MSDSPLPKRPRGRPRRDLEKAQSDYQIAKLITPEFPLKVDKGIPVASIQRQNMLEFYSTMEIGDSHFTPCYHAVDKQVARAKLVRFCKRNPGYRFITRTVFEDGQTGVRIWRVAPIEGVNLHGYGTSGKRIKPKPDDMKTEDAFAFLFQQPDNGEDINSESKV